MKKFVLVFFTAVLLVVPLSSNAGVGFVLDIKPASILFSPDMDGFSVYNNESGSYYYSSYEDRIEGFGSFVPSLNAGVGIATRVMYIDITGQIGYLVNGAFDGAFFGGDVALRFRLGRAVSIGPHISFIGTDLSWGGVNSSGSVEIDDPTGTALGLSFTAGHPMISFSLNLDLVTFEEAYVDTWDGWYADRSYLDLSGFSINMGVIFRFGGTSTARKKPKEDKPDYSDEYY